ncbi:MAG: site-specific integrase [Clostridia bacterium]|nr:site-specific integrase [Clostridia bacterium]
MRHKAQLPSGQWVTGSSDQQLVNNAFEAAEQNQKPRKEIPLLKDYAAYWFETYKRPDIRSNTARDYWTTICKHIVIPLGNMRLDEITTAVIKELYSKKASAGYAKSTLKHIHDYLSAILKSAQEDGLIDKVPTVSERLTKTFRKAPKHERQPVTTEDVITIVSQLEKLETRERLYLALLIYTGMRREEVLALKWEDVDFKENVIHVQHGLQWPDKDGNTPVLGPTKSEAGVRKIPLPSELKALLSPARQLTGFIICANGTSSPITQSMYSGKYGLWARIKKAIPLIAEKGYTAHQFRHAYATAMAKNCKDIKIVQRLMGHSDVRVTMRYNHMDQERLETAKRYADGIYLEHATMP